MKISKYSFNHYTTAFEIFQFVQHRLFSIAYVTSQDSFDHDQNARKKPKVGLMMKHDLSPSANLQYPEITFNELDSVVPRAVHTNKRIAAGMWNVKSKPRDTCRHTSAHLGFQI